MPGSVWADRFTLLFAALVIGVCAGSPVQAARLVTNEQFLASPAAEAFNQNRYEDAIGLLETDLAAHPDDVTLLRYIGISQLRLSRLDEAARSFEKVLALEPQNAAALFFLGQTRLTQGNRDAALDSFRRVTALAPGSTYDRQARTFIEGLGATETAETVVPVKRFNLFAQIGVETDDNVSATSDIVSADTEATRIFEYLAASYRFGLSEDVSLVLGGTGYFSQHDDDHNDYDQVGLTGSLDLETGFKLFGRPSLFVLGYEFDHDLLDRETYSTSHAWSATLGTYLTDHVSAELEYELSYDAFDQNTPLGALFSRDAKKNTYSGRLFVSTSDRKTYGWLGYAYTENLAEGLNEDYTKSEFRFGGVVALPGEFLLDAEITLAEIDYSNFVLIAGGTGRTADQTTYRIGIRRPFAETFEAALSYYRIEEDSDLSAYAYTRDVVTLSLSKTF